MPVAFGAYFCSSALALEHLERVGRRGPEQVDLVVGLGFLEVFHAGIGVAVLHFQRFYTPGTSLTTFIGQKTRA